MSNPTSGMTTVFTYTRKPPPTPFQTRGSPSAPGTYRRLPSSTGATYPDSVASQNTWPRNAKRENSHAICQEYSIVDETFRSPRSSRAVSPRRLDPPGSVPPDGNSCGNDKCRPAPYHPLCTRLCVFHSRSAATDLPKNTQ